MSQVPHEDRPRASELPGRMTMGQVPVADEMSADEVAEMLNELISLVRRPPVDLAGKRPILFTWNGVNFDFPAIRSNLDQSYHDQIVNLAMRSYDPCAQFVRTVGFPIGLDKTAKIMLGEGKPDGMDGSVAASIWTERPWDVVSYNQRDCEITHRTVTAIMSERKVRWLTGTGRIGDKPVEEWMNVSKVYDLPEPNRSWMKDYGGQFDRDKLFGWME